MPYLRQGNPQFRGQTPVSKEFTEFYQLCVKQEEERPTAKQLLEVPLFLFLFF